MINRNFKALAACFLSLMSWVTQAAYVNTTPTPIIANGAMVFTGNTLGLNKNASTNAPGTSGAIGTFMKVNNNCTLDTTSTDGTYPAGTTSNWRLGGSCAVLDIPPGAVVKKAMLIWSGSYNYNGEDVTANLNDPVTLLKPDGTTVSITPANDATRQQIINPYYYTRSADVTSIVTAGGTWGVRGIPATQADATPSANTGGWTMAVIYELSSLPARAMSIFVGSELGGNAAATVSGFCTPSSPTQSGRLLVSAIEGDSGITGDEMRFAKDAATLGTAAGLLSGPNNNVANFFSSQINASNGTLDTRGTFGTSNQAAGSSQIGRQGYDITNVDISSKLIAAQTSAVAQGTTTGDQYMINALGIQVDVGAPKFPVTTKTVDKPSAQVGDILTYTVALQNAGTALATNVLFRDSVPAGTSFVAGSLSYQKTGAVAGAVVALPAADPTLAAGVSIPDISAGDTYTVTFRARVNSIPNSPATAVYDNSANWAYKYQSCAGSPIIDSSVTTNPAQTKVPRLALTKAVSPTGAVSIGDTLTYTLVSTNTGTAPTAGSTLSDAIPAGTTYVAASTTLNGASVADAVGVMPYASAAPINAAGRAAGVLNPGESATVVFSVKVNQGTTGVANTATADVDGAGAAVPVTATANNTIKFADLTVAKTAVGAFVRGKNALFNIEVTNGASAGKTDGTTVTVSDTLPSGLLLSAAPSGTGWACTGSVGAASFSCTRNDVLNPSATYPIIVVPVQVLQSAPTPITNTASVIGGGDTTAATGDATVAVASSADLVVKKIANPINPLPGQNVTFTVTVTNNGVSDATAVSVNDPVPAGMTFVSASASGGTSYVAPTWTIGTLANGATATLTMVATFNGGSATNTATVSSATPDPISTNNSASVSVPSQLADLQLLKAVNTTSPNVGSNVTFTLTLLNNGPDNATGVKVTDLLPPGLVFQSASGGTYSAATGLWDIGNVAALASTSLTIVARVDALSAVSNIAQVSASDQRDPNSTPGNNDPKENDYASVTLIPQSADLQISKAVSNSNPTIGAPITYTITVINKGPTAATGVSVNEPQPAGLTFTSASASPGTFAAPTWTIGTLAPNASATLTINAIYNGPGQVTNTATVTSTTPDPNPSSNSASQTVPSQVADLSLIKTVDNAAPDYGSEVVFTLTLSNAGPANATNVHVADLLPVGLSFVSAAPSQGTYDASSGDWNIGTAVARDVLTLQIKARVDTTKAISNTAEITKSDQFDPDSVPGNGKGGEDDISTVTIVPKSADLSIVKTSSPNAANLNDPISYTIVVKNAGPDDAQVVSVTDLLPAGIAYTSSSATQGSYDSGSGLWTIGTLTAGGSTTLTINGTFTSTTAATITNYAQVESKTPDPNPADNTSKAPIRAKEIDLVVAKTVLTPASAQVRVGDDATFRVTITNSSAVDAATNVKVSDVLPAGLQFVSSIPSAGTYASATGLWFIPTIPANGSATLDITAKLTATTAQTNTAKLIGQDQYETNPANNSANATVTPIYVDLVMGKTISVAAPTIGQAVAFTLSVNNLGISNATGVTVSDPLPAGFAYVSSVPAGQYHAVSGLWTISSIANGATASIQINTTFTGPGPALNSARIASVDQPDINLGNNIASVSVPSQIADLAVTKTASTTQPKPNEVVTFTITVVNNGPDAATTVSVNDALPSGLTLVSAAASQGAYVSPNWTVGALAKGASATLTVEARMTGSVAQDNTATASNPSQIDLNSGNNAQTVTITPQRAEVGITKTVDRATVNVTDTVTFTVVVNNAGPSAATQVRVDDLLPLGLAFVGATASAGSYDEVSGVWQIASIASGSQASLSISARVTGRGPFTNTASITALDQLDNPSNNQAQATVSGTQADLSVTKQANPTNPLPGAALQFVVKVTNNGQDSAQSVVVSDPLPAGYSLISASADVGAYATASGLWSVGTLASGATATLTMNGTFVGPAGLTNVATASSATFDPVTANNRATVNIPSQIADLKVVKTVDAAAPNLGAAVRFNIVVSNAGPDSASGVKLTDLLPAGLTYVSHTASVGAYDPITGLWTIGNLTNAASETLTIDATVSGTAPVTNSARVSGDQFDPDQSTNTSAVDVVPVAANLRLSKAVNNPNPVNGEILTYTVTVTNDGPSAVPSATVTEALPIGLTLVDWTSSQGNFAAPTWSIGALANGAQATLKVRASYSATGLAVANTATVTSPLPDPDPTDNTRTVSVPASIADLSIGKTIDNATPLFGSNVTYTITVRNAGPDAATGVVARDQLPLGLSLVSATPSQGSYDPLTGNWQVGGVANAGVATLAIVAKVTGTATISNSAEITKSDQFDPNSTPNNGVAGENDQATVALTPRYADLRMSKAVDNPQPVNNELITFTLTVINSGNSPATGTNVTDTLPPGLIFVAATASAGSYNAGTGVWTVGTVASGARETLEIQATYVANGVKVINTATATSDLPDPVPADNTASASVPAEIADLSLTKTVDNTRPQVGGEIVFTIRVSNAGPDAARGVVARDALPSGLQYVSSVEGQGVYDPITGLWNIGTIAANANATLTIRARVLSSGAKQNVAEVVGSGQFDPNSTPNNSVASENDQASVNITPQVSNLAVKKVSSVANPIPGQAFAYTVTVTNNGPDAATGVRISDALPAGLTFTSANASMGTYDAATGQWNVGTLANAGVVTLTINVIYNGPGVVVNTASVVADQFDPDTADNSSRIAVPSQIADLKVTKTTSDAKPNVGSNITFTIDLENLGPDAATNVELTDVLPAGLTLVSATPTVGTYTSATGKWAIASIAGGAKVTLTVVATVTGSAPMTNTAKVSKLDQFDPTSTNDISQVTITPQIANLGVRKVSSVANPIPGQAIAYTITVTNNGPDAATNVNLTDVLPVGLTFTSASANVGTYAVGTGRWTIGSLANAGVATLTINVVYNGPGVVVNTATVVSDQFDPDTADNSSRVAVPSQIADLKITKSANTITPNRGTDVTFTIDLENLGPDPASNIEVADALPAGLTLVSASATSGAYASATGKWTVATLAKAGKVTLTVVATAAGDVPVTNTAKITKLDQFDPTTTNDQSQVLITPQLANLSITKTVDQTKPAANELLTYTITVRNAGPSIARSVSVTESLPAGLAYESNTVSVGTFSVGTGIWTVGDLANGAQATLTLKARYTAPGTVVTNSVSVTSTTPDSDARNNTASQSVPADGPDLTLVKRAGSGARQGDTIIYEFVVSNIGGAASVGEVVITDVLPAGLSVTLAAAPTINGWACAVAVQTLTCRRSDVLAAGATYPTLSITAAVARSVLVGELINTASVSGGGDVIASNNSGAASVQVAPFQEVNVPTLQGWLLWLMSLMVLGFARQKFRR